MLKIVCFGIAIFTIILNFGLAELVPTSNTKDFEFDTADLTIDIPTDYGFDHLEAFMSSVNKLIIDTKDKSRYSHLTWLSMGVPKIVYSFTERNETNLFEFSEKGFSFKVEMLNKKTKSKLVEVIKRKYDIDVLEEQIITLIPNSFECSAIIFHEEQKSAFLKDIAKNFFSFPIRVDFKAPLKSKERILFEEKFKNPDSDLSFDCEFMLNAKTSKTNTLQINGEQLNKYGLTEDIFGPSKEVYVTRDQLSSLASELYVKLNIIEDYQMSETEFSVSFVEDFIKQVTQETEKHVNFDDAIKLMSSYNFNKDLRADVIKKELGNIFKVESNSSKSRIILNKENYEHLKKSSATGFSASASASGNIPFIKGNFYAATAYYGNEASDKARYDMSLDDQLKELNKFTDDSIQWEIHGEKILPKSIKVVKLLKAKFSKKLFFNRIRREHFDTLYRKSFTLYTKNLNAQRHEKLQISELVEILKEIQIEMDHKNNEFNEKLEKHYTELLNKTEGNQIQIDKLIYRDLITLKEHTSKIYSLTVLPNGDLASRSQDSTVKIWNTNDGSLKKTLKYTGWIYSLAVLSNGDLASSFTDNTIKILNTTDGSVKMTLIGHTNSVMSLVVLPNGDLASGSVDKTIKIWNTNDGSVKITLTGHTGSILSLAILSNGYLASSSYDNTIKIWDINKGSVIKTLKAHDDTVRLLIVLPNGDLASGSWDKTIKIWNTTDGSVKMTLIGHTNSVMSLVVLPNGDLASGSEDKTIKIWNTADGSVKKILSGHKLHVSSLVVLPNGDLASGSYDKTIRIWFI